MRKGNKEKSGSTVGREIERKFLVKNMSWKDNAEATLYRQGHLSLDPDRAVRVRIAGDGAHITIKSRISELVRREFEYSIPVADAEEMLRELCQNFLVIKKRYRVECGSHVWEIDEFEGENAGLVVAEVELSAADEAVELPDWVGKEITGDTKYLNMCLCKLPFSWWKRK